MLQYINNFLDNISNWINAISLIVSIVTLITMLRFKHKLRVEPEKERFINQKHRIVKKLRGYSESLLGYDDFYQPAFLREIDLFLLDLMTSYTFWGWKLSNRLSAASKYINQTCLVDLSNQESNQTHRHNLTRKLREISALIEKE